MTVNPLVSGVQRHNSNEKDGEPSTGFLPHIRCSLPAGRTIKPTRINIVFEPSLAYEEHLVFTPVYCLTVRVQRPEAAQGADLGPLERGVRHVVLLRFAAQAQQRFCTAGLSFLGPR
jgi:hypothetical protein